NCNTAVCHVPIVGALAFDYAEAGPLGSWVQAQNSNIGRGGRTQLSGARARGTYLKSAPGPRPVSRHLYKRSLRRSDLRVLGSGAASIRPPPPRAELLSKRAGSPPR